MAAPQPVSRVASGRSLGGARANGRGTPGTPGAPLFVGGGSGGSSSAMPRRRPHQAPQAKAPQPTAPQTVASASQALRSEALQEADQSAPPRARGTAPIPNSFRCALSGQVMREPVATCDGQVYELSAIEDWLWRGHRTSPVTGEELQALTLTPQLALQAAIQAFVAHPSAPQAAWCEEPAENELTGLAGMRRRIPEELPAAVPGGGGAGLAQPAANGMGGMASASYIGTPATASGHGVLHQVLQSHQQPQLDRRHLARAANAANAAVEGAKDPMRSSPSRGRRATSQAQDPAAARDRGGAGTGAHGRSRSPSVEAKDEEVGEHGGSVDVDGNMVGRRPARNQPARTTPRRPWNHAGMQAACPSGTRVAGAAVAPKAQSLGAATRANAAAVAATVAADAAMRPKGLGTTSGAIARRSGSPRSASAGRKVDAGHRRQPAATGAPTTRQSHQRQSLAAAMPVPTQPPSAAATGQPRATRGSPGASSRQLGASRSRLALDGAALGAPMRGQLKPAEALEVLGADRGHLAVDNTMLGNCVEGVGLEAKDPSQSPGIDATDEAGRTALMHAAGEGDPEALLQQLEHGATVDATDECRCTALMYAATYGHREAVKCLVEHGAAVEATSKDGWTPLITAAYNGHLEVVDFLLSRGARIEASDERGWTSLMHVAFNGDNQTLRCLLESKAHVDALDSDGRTALVYAAFNGHLENVRCLLQSSGKENYEPPVDGARDTALLFASIHGHVEVVRALLEVAAASQETRHAALKLAADHGHHAVVELLVRRSAVELQLGSR